jgi:hypothetical protein
MSNKLLRRVCTTDNGEQVVLRSPTKACELVGNEVKARQEARGIKRGRYLQKPNHFSGMSSPTRTVCGAVRSTMTLSPKLGGTNGEARHDGHCRRAPDQGEVDVLLLVSLYEAEDLRKNPTDGYGKPRA